MKKQLYIFLITTVLLSSACSISIKEGHKSESSPNIVEDSVLLSSDISIDTDVVSKYKYLPDETYSLHRIIRENDKFLCLRNLSGFYYPEYGEVEIVGIKYFITKRYGDNFPTPYSLKNLYENKYYLEIDTEYNLVIYVLTYKKDINKYLLHAISDLDDFELFIQGQNSSLENKKFIPSDLGKIDITLKYSNFEFSDNIEVVEKGSMKKEKYSISFRTDHTFKGTSITQKTFSEGDVIKIYREIHEGEEVTDSPLRETIVFNGYRCLSSVETFELPPMDLVIDYYTYEGIPDFVDDTIYLL